MRKSKGFISANFDSAESITIGQPAVGFDFIGRKLSLSTVHAIEEMEAGGEAASPVFISGPVSCRNRN
jgi:hypothetical protein